MSRYWYLLNNKDLIGGCGDVLSEYSGFSEALNTAFAETVELYNYDLTWNQTIKVIIQGNFPDTEEKSKERQMLTIPNTCHAGMYVKYKDRFWLIVGMVSGNGIYEKALLDLCNYQLTWLNTKNQIVQRWGCIDTISPNNSGETGNDYYDVRNDGMYITLPDDEECMFIHPSTRFIIDRRCSVYEKGISDNADFPVTKSVHVYKLKRTDSVGHNYSGSGVLSYIVTQDEMQDGDGCYLVNGTKYWLCAPLSDVPDESEDVYYGHTEILCDAPTLYVGIDPVICTAIIKNDDGDPIIDAKFSWEVVCDFKECLSIDYADNSILISTESQKLIGNKFKVVLHSEGLNDSEITVEIKAFI